MIKLPLIVPFHPDETPMSWVSRLAARNGLNARRFCLDFRMRFQAVVDGDEGVLGKAAGLGGIDPEPLLANAFTKTAHVTWAHRGQVLHPRISRRHRIAICPRCAIEDIGFSPKLRPHVAIYGRTAWLLDAVRTCSVHRIPLVLTSEPLGNQLVHDFTAHVANVVPRLAELSASASPQQPSALETYVLGRFDGKTGSPLLDPMPLPAALRLCEAVGTVLSLGDGNDLKELTDDEWHKVNGQGFEAIAEGAGALVSLLDRLMDGLGPRDRLDGPRVAFGRIYDLLHATVRKPEFDAVRDIVREYIVGKFTFKKGHNLLGKPVEVRKLHSLHTLAQEVGIHPKRLRKHLRAARLMTDAQMLKSDHNVLIDADQARRIAQDIAGTVSLAGAMEHLNAPRTQMGLLVKAGLVQPRLRVAHFGAQDRYAVTELDAFLAGLRRNPRKDGSGRPPLRNIPDAARLACRSAAEVIGLILEGKLPTAVSKQVRGYMGILVDPKAVVKALRRAETGGVSLRVAARQIGTSDMVLVALVKHGHVASFRAANPVNMRVQTLVSPDEIKRFNMAYVALSVMAKERGLFSGTMKRRLDEAGAKPVFDPKKIGARFYLRKAIDVF